MSKSLGNVVEPSSVILGDGKMRHKHRGTDLLRYWSISSDYTRDIQIGSEILGIFKKMNLMITPCRKCRGSLTKAA